MADIHLPATLTPLFTNLPRHVEVDAVTIGDAIAQLEQQWPGLTDRLCEPGPRIRSHIQFYVDQERALLDTPLEQRSRVEVIAAISGG